MANEGGGAVLGRMVMCESVGQGKRATSWLSGEGEPTLRRMGPEKQSGHEFPHGQTALLVPSDNQKTVSRFNPRDESESLDGERGQSACHHSCSLSLAGP